MATTPNMSLSLEAQADYLEPRRTETCAVCKKTGCQIATGGWYTETTVEYDDEGAFLEGAGESLREADESPFGWFCSNACRSQMMYASASESEQYALDRTLDACLAILEYAAHAEPAVERYFFGNLPSLIEQASRFLNEIAYAQTPTWCNRPTREEALESQLAKRELLDPIAEYLKEQAGVR